MTKTEKLWTGDVKHMYPKQWIVFTDMEFDNETNKYMGLVHYVTPNKQEAYDLAIALGDSMGDNMVIEGYDDTPCIGGLYVLTPL
ncbi:MAG: hypothetical protein FWB71_02805 [Defluviitaleaceae bacterium]|nr:hypothetical protein [Defluviitaleaceae bacterium]